MLRSLWAALLQDYAMLSTQHPATLSSYASELLPPTQSLDAEGSTGGTEDGGIRGGSVGGSAASPVLAAAVRDVYRLACPQVLQVLVEYGGLHSTDVLEQVWI